ncbi:MAG: MG2 domain-containing protein [Armatimonadota bacterium]
MRRVSADLVKWLAFATVAIAVSVAVGVASQPSSGDISPLQTVVMGQTRWLAGGPASLRVIVTNHSTGEPVPGAVHIALTPADKESVGKVSLYDGRLREGTADATFGVPDLKPGAYEMSVRVVSRLGVDDVKQPITIARDTQILLTTDKPLYQPSQTIHLRALALRRPKMLPAEGDPITLEIEDANGNKVFKKTAKASQFGIVSAEFQLADEINMGRYVIRAIAPDGQAERTVEVKRYVLPKFKVTLTTDRSYYLPGETVTGKVQCDYFFGKPTSDSEVLITVSTFDVGFSEIAEIKGTTDGNGTYKFETELPDTFVGLPLEQGNAFVKLDCEVTDKADHTEKITQSVPVAKDPLLVVVVPESRDLKMRLTNIIYVLVSTPDGRPVEGASVSIVGKNATTDRAGICHVTITGVLTRSSSIGVTVSDQAGHRVSRLVDLAIDRNEQSLILRSSRAIAKVGDSVGFTVISTKQKGTTYVDVIRDNQTVLTRAVDLKGGRSEFELPLTADLQGTLQVNAYQILPDENIVRDTRLLYVEPANDLVVEVRPNQDTYRPGEQAELDFAVRDQHGRATLAALGVTIVDESVFALQEMQPGLERIYFALEKELLEPRYEIHGFTPEGIVTGKLPFEEAKPAEDEALRQRAATVLFAAAQQRDPYTLNVNTYDRKLQEAMDAWVKEMARDAEKIDRALKRYYEIHRSYLPENAGINTLLDEGLLKKSDLRDRWGNAYRVSWYQVNSNLSSAGPDGKWDTRDDLQGIGQWAKDGIRGPMLGRGVRAARGGFAGAIEVEEMAAMDAVMFKAEAMPAAAPAEQKGAAQPQVRLRQFFPETMYVNPAIITDERGRATVTVQMADSITTWRMQALASSQKGQLGSTTTGLRVFQDFFIDIDLPVALTQNDEVSIPIAIYNYLPKEQTVKLSLEQESWFELVGDEAEKSVEIGASDIKAIYYRIRVKGIGNHSLTVHAQGTKLSDAIKRQIEVLPDGEERRDTWNDRLDGTVKQTVTIPKEAIADASTILVKIYPGLFSQAVEGLDALLRMPFGCFEQTSSVTYPNVLVLDYLKSVKMAKPEVQMKAEQYINVGYQRLLSFEVKGGGFSWFGDAPAHKVLTSYGLLEFRDMSRVHEVDENVITRTQNWLAGLQQKDGSWQPDQGGIAEGIINRQTDTLRVTAYIAWALAESASQPADKSGYKGAAVEKAFGYLDAHWKEAKDPYALAVIANAYLSGGRKGDQTADVLAALAKLATVEGPIAYWKTDTPTFTSAKDGSADLETTALAAYALVKSGRYVDLTNKAITYLIRGKDSFGTWQTTQATVWALKTLLLSMRQAAQEVNGTVTVTVNGKEAASFRITPEDYDVVRQVDARSLVHAGANDVSITLKGKGSALYQIVSKYYLPWALVKPAAEKLLTIDVSYDRAKLATDDIITASVRVVNNDPREVQMVVIDLGLPPGFALMSEDFDKLVAGKTIQKYTVAARQIIVYLDKLASRKPLEFSYRLRAKFPIKAATPASTVYRYYNPEIKATAKPAELEVL